MSLHKGGWVGGGGGGVIPFCITLRFVFLMLQTKVIDCNNTYLLGAQIFHKYLPKIKTLNQAYDLYKTNKYFFCLLLL